MRRLVARALTIAGIAVFVTLGVWQLERRAWKLDLIARTERNLAAPATSPPPVADKRNEYRRIVAEGRWVTGRDVRVQAVTELGGGFWVLTPLATRQGVLLVNRGFVPPRTPVPPPGDTRVIGLLRLSEPGGGFLRSNDPAAGRWYSRDVAAIAAAQGLGPTLPYFLDADRCGDGWPRGGLTVVRFRNTHLVYALTWFAMAALLAFLALRRKRER